MYLPPLFVLLLLSSFVTPTEETLQFELPSILTSIFGIGNNGSSLSRQKREASDSIKEYSVDIEVSFQDPILQSAIKNLIANLSFPIPLNDLSTTSIQRINVTTVCNQVGDNLQCACEQGFIWAPSICNANTPCDASTKDSCNCINMTINNGLYCKAKNANNLEKSFSLKIKREFTEDMKNSSATAYLDLKNELEIQFFNTYSTLPGYESAVVKGFRNGSVLADYTIVAEAVTDATMKEANDRLRANLASQDISVDGILIITSENISVSKTFPTTDVFVGDRVDILCSFLVTNSSETSVKWYLNGNQITNSPSNVITKTENVSSTLQIPNVTGSDVGTFKCTVETDIYSYQAEYNLTAQYITMNILNTNIPCNNTNVSVVQCCASGNKDLLNLTCQNMSGNYQSSKYAYFDNGTSCRVLDISATLIECNGGASTNFICTCSSNHGAAKSEPVNVTYAQSRVEIYNNTNVQISQGTELVLVCDGTGPISWTFSMNGSFLHSFNVTSEYVIFQNETSLAVKIPRNSTNLSWQGTFYCSNLFSTAEANVTVISLFPSDRISIQPITFNYVYGQRQSFQCCVPNYPDNYTHAVLTTATGFKQDMVKNGPCFTTEYTFSDSKETSFQANCQVFNQLNDFVHSQNMTGTQIEKTVNMCNDSQISVGVPGNNVTVSCETQDATKTGNITFVCSNSGQWTPSENNCVSAALNRLSVTLEELTSPGSVGKVPLILSDISATVNDERRNITSSPSELKFVVELLIRVDAAVTVVEESTMKNFLSTVDVVVDNSSVNTWRNVSNESDRLLSAVDKFADKLVFSDRVEIKNNTNIQLVGRVIIAGERNSFNETFDFSQLNNLTGHVLIKAVDAIQENRSIVSVAYATLKDILPVDTATWGNKTLNGLVMSTIAHLKNDTPFSISMDYEKSDKRKNKAQCVFWNVTEKQWDSNGCSVIKNNDNVTCNCSHLTSFSILMSYEDEIIDPTATPPPIERLLAYITYIGVGISILSLVICIGVEATVWKSVTKNKTSYMRHVCIVNIAVSLLIADIWFIVGAALSDMKKKAASNDVLTSITNACVAVTFFTHLFYLSVFFWMLTMALILFYRLVYVFHDLSKTVMMSISFTLGYGCPLVISVITVAVTQPNKAYTSNKACWLTTGDSKAFIAFVVPALAILLVNTIILCVVLRKLCRPAIGDKQKKDEAETLKHIAKCIVILTPLLGLTWGLGIGTMTSSEDWIHIVFTSVNSLQGLFILLFGCLMDKKVREALFNKFSLSRFSSQQTKSTNISSSDTPFSKTVMSRGVLNLFTKKGETKGSYNINTAQVSSSSDIPSNSYSLLQ